MRVIWPVGDLIIQVDINFKVTQREDLRFKCLYKDLGGYND